jgi:hypothetical protein
MFTVAVGASVATVAAGCAPEPAPSPPTTAGAGADGSSTYALLLDGSRVLQAGAPRASAPSGFDAESDDDAAGAVLRYELRRDARVVATGAVTDPRWRRSETLTVPLASSEIVAAGGVFELALPARGGELVLFDAEREVARGTLAGAHGTGVRSLDRGPIAAPASAVAVVDHGRCNGELNVLVMPEGFRASELDGFHAQVEALAAAIAIPGIAEYAPRINVWRADVASAESGLSDVSDARDTAWNVQFGVAPEPRRAAFWASAPKPTTWEAYSAARASSRAEVLVVLVNSREDLGATDVNRRIIVMSTSALAPRALVHELGHAIFGLADEYGYGTCDRASAGRHANTTTHAEAPPWADLVASRPVEGADYCASGVFRPLESCLMRSLTSDLCPVCARKIKSTFEDRERRAQRAAYPECVARVADCGLDADAACAPGLICSANGEGSSCCRKSFVPGTRCYADTDCPTGQLCALAATEESPDGASLGCIAPGEGCAGN